MNKTELQQRIIELRQLEEAYRFEIKEYTVKLKDVRDERVLLERLLHSGPN